MARSLGGKNFFGCYNNGVTALVSEETLRNREKCWNIISALGSSGDRVRDASSQIFAHIPTTPIFTFADSDRVSRSPWFSGDTNLLRKLERYISRKGGRSMGGSVHVPFSNAAETGVHGPEAQLQELRYVTSQEQFVETFGVTIEELRRIDL